MNSIDLNADMGEYANPEQQACEAALMPLLSSCSIACGGHAGNEETMRITARLAKQYGVSIGAHPSYPDRDGFGRRKIDIAIDDLLFSLQEQIESLRHILDLEKLRLSHVKPHGALYNAAAQDAALAEALVKAAGAAIIVGPPDSALEAAAREAGRAFAKEGFVDRLYQASGALTPRTQPGAVIADIKKRAAQAAAIAQGKRFPSADGDLAINADTLCIHSDSPGAVETAQAVRKALNAASFQIRSFS